MHWVKWLAFYVFVAAAGWFIIESMFGRDAQAQQAPRCENYDTLVARIHRDGEARIGWGLSGQPPNQVLFEVFARPDNEDSPWTILSIQPSGRACFAAHGKNWQIYEYVDPRGTRIEEPPLP